MDVRQFLEKLHSRGLRVIVEDGNIVLKSPKGNLTPEQKESLRQDEEIIDYLKRNKKEIIRWLQQHARTHLPGHNKNILSLYELTPLQEGILFHGLYDGDPGSYIEQFSCDLQNPDTDVLRQSWQHVLADHSVLRTAFFYEEMAVPVQCVYKEVQVPFEIIDYSGFNRKIQDKIIVEYLENDRKRGFDCTIPPLMRISLLKLSSDVYKLVWTFHHTILDGWSMAIVMDEVLQAYRSLKAGSKPDHGPEDRYEDLIKYLRLRDANAAEKFWKQYMAGCSAGTLLPFALPATEATGISEVSVSDLVIEEGLSTCLRDYAKRNQITVNTLIQGCWAFLLSKYTGDTDVVYGVTVSGRPGDLQHIEQRVGLYINTLPFRSVMVNKRVCTWLQELQQAHTLSREYQYSGLTSIRQWAGIQGAFFNSILVFENYPVNKSLKQQEVLVVDNIRGVNAASYPLSVVVSLDSQLQVSFNYKNNVISSDYIALISRHFKQCLLQMVSADDILLQDLELATDEDRTLIGKLNDTTAAYANPKSITALFEEQADNTPDKIAVIFGDIKFTYRQLDQQANKWAHYLISKGVRAETLVAVHMHRSHQLLPCLLGILKAGGAYVPVSPSYPEERIRYMLLDTKATVIISDDEQGLPSRIQEFAQVIPALDNVEIAERSPLRPNQPLQASGLAYVMYTSGSTGKPKGVMVEHGNVVSLVKNIDYVQLSPADVLLSTGSPSFDATTFEYWAMLLHGGTLVLCPEAVLLDGTLLKNEIDRGGVTTMWFTAGWFNQLVDNHPELFNGLRTILVGGDRLSKEHIGKLLQVHKNITVINGYGPTENTTFSITCRIDQLNYKTIPLGQPLTNRTAYIVNDHGGLCAVGVPGEIYVGGAGVSRGYLNDAALTAGKFVPDLFGGDPQKRLYRTGDRGCLLPDGKIEFLGRLDQQVKIRGYRVETGEVESILQQFPGVAECVVIARENNWQEKYLAAYVVSNDPLDNESVIAFLRSRLPAYMIPAMIIQLDALPLSPNGKVNRQALPEKATYVTVIGRNETPRNSLENKLADIWKGLLQIDRIGIYDNFFDLGGHSLMAMRAIAAIRKGMQAQVSVRDLFERPTIASLAAFLQSKSNNYALPAITASDKSEKVLLSFAQERLSFIHQMEGSVHYHISVMINLEGLLDKEALAYSFRTIINRHESLRTVIRRHDDQVYQHIIEDSHWQLQFVSAKEVAFAATIAEKVINQPFDLYNDHMIRATLVGFSNTHHQLVVVVHHIAADGWSMSLMVNELTELYRSYRAQRPHELPALPVQYVDYSRWQRAFMSGMVLDEQLKYWKTKLAGSIPLDLPGDYPRPPVQSIRGACLEYKIDKSIADGLMALTRQQGATMFMTLIAAYYALLFRYTGQQDICIGTPVANRSQQELESLVGFFVNTVVLRAFIDGGLCFTDFLKQVKNIAFEAFDHQETPFEKVVEALPGNRDQSRTPLFQTAFVLQNTPQSQSLNLQGISFNVLPVKHTYSKYDLTFTVTENNDGLGLSIEYCTDLYSAEKMAQMAQHYQVLLSSIVTAPAQPMDKLPLMTAEEEGALLQQGASQKQPYPKHETLVSLFEKQVLQTPDAQALIHEGSMLTYRELNTRVNQLARLLRTKYQVNREVLVGLCMERSPEMVIGILGILKAGGGYVPIDPSYPPGRKSFMLKDASVKLVITDGFGHAGESGFSEWIWNEEELQQYEQGDIAAVNTPADICYVIYTSGSTGTPKGVMVQHNNVVNLLYAGNACFGFGATDIWTLFHSVCFDFSVWELFGCLVTGGKLVIVSWSVARDVSLFARLLVNERVTILNQVPTMFSNVSDELLKNEAGSPLCIRYVIFGGEALQPRMLEHWRRQYPQTRLVNMYGITETTVHVTCKEITEKEVSAGMSNIGMPLGNVELYIMDRYHRLVPAGTIGEIVVGGGGVTRGYLNRPDLNADRFIDNPYRNGERLYCSGDMGIMQANGEIIYKGRADNQVKIRGYRIELGEIERCLLGHQTVAECAVVNHMLGEGNNQLVAYTVCTSPVTLQVLRTHLLQHLPEYMLPAQFVTLDRLPVTVNGKLDRGALPPPYEAGVASATTYEAPGNTQEHQLAEIWQELLNVQRVSVHDNFFELGGHSLKATQLVSRINKQLSASLDLRQVFTHPTLREQATIIAAGAVATYHSIEPVVEQAYYPLSHAQRRLWILGQMEKENVAYNLFNACRLVGKLNPGRFEQAFISLVARHEILRTNLKVVDGEPRQFIQPRDSYRLPMMHTNLQAFENREQRVNEITAEEILKPFDLTTDALIRIRLIKLSEEEHIFILTMHHIITDGWSLKILVKEILALYNVFTQGKEDPLAPLAIQYKDYAVWQQSEWQKIRNQESRAFWHKQFQTGIPVLNMRYDQKRPAIKDYKGDRFNFFIAKDTAQALGKLAHEKGCTLFMTLLGTVLVLLHRYTEQEDIVIGTPVAGREHKDLEDQIGFYINMLPLRNRFQATDNFEQLLHRIKNQVLQVFDHQSYPFDWLINELPVPRDPGKSPLFDVVVQLENGEKDASEIINSNTFRIERFEHDVPAPALYDLVFDFAETGEGIAASILYNTTLFRKDTIVRMAGHYLNLVKAMVANSATAINQLVMIGAAERDLLIHGFNNTQAPFPANRTVVQLFEEQTAATPDAIAIVKEGASVTYTQLNVQANRIAHFLRSNFGVGREDRVGVVMDRSFLFIASILGILKSGACYVPVDKEYPEERIQYLFQDAQVRTVLTEGDLSDDLLAAYSTLNPEPVNEPSDLAYIIYTSGSTGSAKGVMIEHRSLTNLCTWHKNAFDVTASSKASVYAGISFDASVWEIWPYLLSGASLYPLNGEIRLDLDALRHFLQRNQVTHCFLPTVICEQLLANAAGLNKDMCMLTGGEKLKKNSHAVKLVNNYGPTEAAVVATSINMDHIDYNDIPIGKPIANTTIFILNSALQLQPVGVPGEIFIAGAGLARGYVNRGSLTAEMFPASPFEPGKRMYKTGDLGYWQPDGQLVFLGRKDKQVKISGYRIEPAEIESALMKIDGITEAVVMVRENGENDKDLAAYFCGDSNIKEENIKASLARALPAYMIPRYFTYLEQLPVTMNGKIDTSALPAPEETTALGNESDLIAENETEERLIELWRKILNTETVSVNMNFFEAGGNSLKLISLHRSLAEMYENRISIPDLFVFNTIRSLSAYLNNNAISSFAEGIEV